MNNKTKKPRKKTRTVKEPPYSPVNCSKKDIEKAVKAVINKRRENERNGKRKR